MELTEWELRSHLRDIDYLHRDGMATMATDLRDLHAETRLGRAGALDDATIAAFAASVEYTAVAAYKAAAASGKVKTPAVGAAATMFAGHHKEHGDSFQAASGGKIAKDATNPTLLKALSDQLMAAADEKAVVKVAYDTENAAAATYLFALGALQSPDALKLTASILPIESAHAVVLAGVLGLAATDATYLPPFETKKAALDPAKFPLS